MLRPKGRFGRELELGSRQRAFPLATGDLLAMEEERDDSDDEDDNVSPLPNRRSQASGADFLEMKSGRESSFMEDLLEDSKGCEFLLLPLSRAEFTADKGRQGLTRADTSACR